MDPLYSHVASVAVVDSHLQLFDWQVSNIFFSSVLPDLEEACLLEAPLEVQLPCDACADTYTSSNRLAPLQEAPVHTLRDFWYMLEMLKVEDSPFCQDLVWLVGCSMPALVAV